jgi:hypothetical protein
VVSRSRPAAGALGLRPPGARLDAGRLGGAVPQPAPRLRAGSGPPLHGGDADRGAPTRCFGNAAADAARRGR